MVNIILADDHQVVRKGIKSLLITESDFNIIGEAGNGLEAIELVLKLQPDILVLDLMMPGLNGLEVTRELNKKCPGTSVVILSMHSNEAYIIEALRSGAKAYILKDSSPEDLIFGIREVISGRSYLSSPLSENTISTYTPQNKNAVIDPYDALTSREREIFLLAAQGFSNHEIASRLYISPRTVETHRTNLMHKLGIHNHAQLIQLAVKRKLLTPMINTSLASSQPQNSAKSSG